MADLHRRALRFIRSRRLLHDGDAAVLGFSGGPDSVALALLLRELALEGELRVTLHLAHLNHRLRGAESEADEQFCRRFAERHALPIHVGHADVAGAAEAPGRSVESAARRARYAFLGRTAQAVGCRVVATAHHADDVAETVLMRLLRGAGMRGLGAMPPQRMLGPEHPDVRLVRPLLGVRKAELLAFLAERRQAFRTDSSNADLSYTRNRVRHELLPMLRRRFGTFSAESLCALNEAALDVGQLLERMVDDAWPGLLKGSAGAELLLDAEAFAGLPIAVRKAAARRALEELSAPGQPPALRAEHLRDLAALAEEAPGAQASLPGGWFARRERGLLYLARRDATVRLAPRLLSVPGTAELPEIGVSISARRLARSAMSPDEAAAAASACDVYLDLHAVGAPLEVRSRRPGDRFHALGLPASTKLKKFLNGRGVPYHRRDRTPLVTAPSGEIAWVVGHEIAAPFRLTGAERDILHLQARPVGG